MPTSTRRKRPFYGGLPANPCWFSILRRRGGRPCPPAGKCPFSRKTNAKSQHFQWADVGIGPYDRQRKISRFCGRTESCAPTKGIWKNVRRIDFHTSNIGRHHGVSGARNRPVLQTPGAFVKSIFYVVGVDAYIDPQETTVLWRPSGETALIFYSTP